LQAPEVFKTKGKEYKYTDVFALGMVIFVVLTGERLLADVIDDAHVQMRLNTGKRPDVTKLPVEFQDLASRCWQNGMFHRLIW
jgi:hypothetical protein